RQPVDVAGLVTSVGQMVRDTFPSNVTVTTTIAAHLWPGLGDHVQWRQALLNLCINARDAMPGGGELRIAAENVSLDTETAAQIVGGNPGPHVCVSVSDTGAGI